MEEAADVSPLPEAILGLKEEIRELSIAINSDSKQGGGIIQHFADGGYVKGPGGKDKVPAMLTAGEFVVPKDMVQNFYNGKRVEEKAGFGERLVSGTKGAIKSEVMGMAAEAASRSFQKSSIEAPTFDMNKLNTLGIGSDVNIKRGDRRLSSRFMAQDSVMDQYRGYLQEQEEYAVAKKNEKFQKRMGIFKSILGVLGSAGIGALTSNVIAPLISKARNFVGGIGTKAANYFKGDLGLGKHSDTFKSMKARFPDKNINYSHAVKMDKTGAANIGGEFYTDDYFNPSDGLKSNELANRSITLDREATQRHRQNLITNSYNDLSKIIGDVEAEALLSEFEISRNKKGKFIRRQGGGDIPAMLTAGEGYIPAPIAKRIGYNNLNHMNNTGSMPIVKGTGGIDNVGPVGLNSGDFIMKKSSTNKLLRDNPNAMRFSLQGQSDGRRGAQGYYEGGVVGSELTVPGTSLTPQGAQQGGRLGLLEQRDSEKTVSGVPGSTTSAETTNNISINISIDKAGAEVETQEGEEGSYEKERDLSMKIKGAVLEVIREEKRIGGELS